MLRNKKCAGHSTECPALFIVCRRQTTDSEDAAGSSAEAKYTKELAEIKTAGVPVKKSGAPVCSV